MNDVIRPRRRLRSTVLGIVALPLVFALMIVWHECGHTLAAWLTGDRSARFEFVDLSYPCVGCNLYDSAALSPIPNAFVNAAGVLSTQVLAWTAVILLIRRRRSPLVTWLLIDVIVVTVADLIWQCVQPFLPGAQLDAPLGHGVTYVDGSAMVTFLQQATGLAPAALAALLLTLAATNLVALSAVLVVGIRSRRRATGMTQTGPVATAATPREGRRSTGARRARSAA